MGPVCFIDLWVSAAIRKLFLNRSIKLQKAYHIPVDLGIQAQDICSVIVALR